MKNIRIDYYHYRLRKGRADILLQKTEGDDEFCIPFRYVKDDEPIAWSIKHNNVEDDKNGDLVIIDCSLNDCHLKKNRQGEDKNWIPLNDVRNTHLSRNESLELYKKILIIFLRLCPKEGNLGIIDKVCEMLEYLLVEMAKIKYVKELRHRLDQGKVVYPGGYSTPPNPNLVKKEIETLEHFRLYKPHEIPMTLRDGILQDSMSYSYEPIDWELYGSEKHFFPVSPTPFGRNIKPSDLDEGELVH